MQLLAKSKRYAITVSTLLILSGCNGSGKGLDENGNPLGSTNNPPTNTPTSGSVKPTFADIQAKVFTPTCAVSGCHSGPAAPLGLKLDSNSSFDLLVNQASQQQAQLLRIKPNDPDSSYIIQKLEGTAVSGLQMPRNQQPLSIETIQTIRKWIENGALAPRLSSIQANIFTPYLY